MTSHDVVAQVRRKLRQVVGKVKVGHAGTLDPMATGVLVVCVGYATRLSEFVMHSTKTYHATVLLGIETDTYDADGEAVATHDPSHITQARVEVALEQYRGTIEQVPPMYSAIKQGGRKLYEMARAGETIERPPRAVTIDSLTLTNWQPPQFELEVVCSPGTYIRSLAHDIGQDLGIGAHLTGLVRVASGGFRLAEALPMDAFIAAEDWHDAVVSPQAALPDWVQVVLDAEQEADVRQGRAIANPDGSEGVRALALDTEGNVVAILQSDEELWNPRKVFPT